MREKITLIAPPRVKGDLALRLFQLEPSQRLMAMEHEVWEQAAADWSRRLQRGEKLIFLDRDDLKLAASIELTHNLWIPRFGKCTGCLEIKMNRIRQWMLAFHEANPFSTRRLMAEQLVNFSEVKRGLEGLLALEEENYRDQLSIVTHRCGEIHEAYMAEQQAKSDALMGPMTKGGILPDGNGAIQASSWAEFEVALNLMPKQPQVIVPVPADDEEEDWTGYPEPSFEMPEHLVWASERSHRAKLGIQGRVLPPLSPLKTKVKVVVYTLQYGNPDWLPECFASLTAWVARCGYELVVWDEQMGFPEGHNRKFAVVWMLRHFLKGDGEQFLYIDADVLIHPQAGEMDPVNGISAAYDEYIKILRWDQWLRFHRLGERGDHVYRQAGVWNCDRKGAAAILAQAEKGPWHDGIMEQHQWNVWLRDAEAAGTRLELLSQEWNMLVGRRADPAYFYHLTFAKDKKKLLEKLRLLRQIPFVPTPLPEWTEERLPAAICIPWLANSGYMGELRLAVKSWRKFFSEPWPIIILGDRAPAWIHEEEDVRFVHAPKYEEALAKAVQMADRIAWSNDDIFLVNPVKPDDLKLYFTGTLRAAESLLEDENGWWQKTGEVVCALEHHGIRRVKNFSTHLPYLWDGKKATELLAQFKTFHKIPFELIYGMMSGEPVVPLGKVRAGSIKKAASALFLNLQRNEDWAGGVKAWLEDLLDFRLPMAAIPKRRRKIYFLTREKLPGHEAMLQILGQLGEVEVVEDSGDEEDGFCGMAEMTAHKKVTAYDRVFQRLTGAEPVWLIEDDVAGSAESLSQVMDAGDAAAVDLCAIGFASRDGSDGWPLWDCAPTLPAPLVRAFTPLCRLSADLVNEIHMRRLRLGFHEHHELSFATLARSRTDLRELVPDAFGAFAWRPLLKEPDPRGKIAHPVKI